jgi:acyl-CoA synthetase (AMP-forming)/AMP-acid ligase II
MEGYLHAGRVKEPWHTGDLGCLDQDGFLCVTGRKDTLLVTSSGRNISPEWVEAMVLSDPRIGACVVLGHGMSHLSALLIPSALGERWLMTSPRAHILLWLEQICIDAPAYAVPKEFVVCPLMQAERIGLLTANGRCPKRLSRPQDRPMPGSGLKRSSTSKGEMPWSSTIGLLLKPSRSGMASRRFR